jgi:hypothetical protein
MYINEPVVSSPHLTTPIIPLGLIVLSTSYVLFKNYFFIYSYVYTLLGPFLSLLPAPAHSPPQTPSLPGRTCSAVFSNFVEEKT